MNNDLISREALKEEINKKRIVGRFNTIQIIDNAPTVDLSEWQIEFFSRLYEKVRPQGEWIDYNAYYKTCSICKRTVGIDFLIQKYEDKPEEYSFCPNCGAKMKGGAE